MKKKEKPIVVSIETEASSSIIWHSLTDLAQMRQWLFPEIPSFAAEVGFSTSFDIKTENQVFKHHWLVKEVVHKKRLVVEWSYIGHAGKADVIYEIIRSDDTKEVKLTNKVTEDFDDSIPEFRRESAEDGWTFLIENRLATLLGK